jgi:translation initiation factor IF-2
LGKLKVLKIFNTDKDRHVVGGKVIEGVMRSDAQVKIVRRDFDMGKGLVTELQSMKMKTKEVMEGNECGIEIETKHDIIPGDVIVAYLVEKKKLV